MRLLVFHHIECEHPGHFRALFGKDRVEWKAVELDEGEDISDLEKFDALWVMGGPMDVWDIEEYPWLIAEKAAIRRWVKDLKIWAFVLDINYWQKHSEGPVVFSNLQKLVSATWN